jgi:hypothetical protein
VIEFEGQRRFGHDGAIYLFATTRQVLPESKLGVVAVANKDFANSVVDRIAETALRWMLAARRGEGLTPPEATQPVPRNSSSACPAVNPPNQSLDWSRDPGMGEWKRHPSRPGVTIRSLR